MERVIKFRLPWFKFKDNSFSHFSYWGRIDHKGESSKDCFTAPGMSSPCYCKEDQQFIGLLDKNGKEIYEGDIVKHPICEIGKVIYFQSYAGFQVESRGILYDLNLNNECEVIGNLWENPKLINN